MYKKRMVTYFLSILLLIPACLLVLTHSATLQAQPADPPSAEEKEDITKESVFEGFFSDEESWGDEWDPYGDASEIKRRMNRMFQHGFRHWLSRSRWNRLMDTPVYEPAVDLKDTGEAYVIEIDVPGISKDKIELTVREGVLTVKGEREAAHEETEEDEQGKIRYHRRERSFGSFQRSIPLPEDADRDSISAEYENGVLTVMILKKEVAPETEQEKKITIL